MSVKISKNNNNSNNDPKILQSFKYIKKYKLVGGIKIKGKINL